MSLSNVPVDTFRIIDPRVAMNSKRDYYALKSGQVNTWQQFPAANISNNNIVITCTPPSKNTMISKRALIKTFYNITVTGTNTTGGSLIEDGYFAPRAYPYSQVVLNQSMKMANDNISVANFNQYWATLMWYHNNHDDRYKYNSITPAMLDQDQTYGQSAQGVRNPLGGYQDNSYEMTRGAYSGLQVVSNPLGGTTATLTLLVVEPLFMSPWNWGCESKYEAGFIGLNNLTYSASLGNLERLLSINADGIPGIAITAVTATLENAQIEFEYITPDPFIPIPRMTVYPFFDCVLYTQDNTNGPVVSGGIVGLKLPNIQLSSIPRRFYIWAGRSQSDKDFSTSDAYMSLTGQSPLTVTYDTSQLFQQATVEDLYLMSVENGLQMSFDQFVNNVGSVVCIDLGKDLMLPHDKCPGMLDNVNFSFQANFINNSPETLQFTTLNCLVVYEGVLTVSDGSCSHYLAPVSRNDLLNSTVLDRHAYKQAEKVYGGNQFTSIRDFVTKAYPKISNALASGNSLVGGKHSKKHRKHKKRKGGVLVERGGKMISRSALHKRMKGGALDADYEEFSDEENNESIEHDSD